MPTPEPPALLGAYTPPAVKVGDVVRCLYRRAECRVTAWTDAPLPWPRCRQLGIQGGSGLLITVDLIRAVQTESAAALKHWFGVSTKAAWNWRKRFVPGEGKFRTAGSRDAHQRASEAGAAGIKAKVWTDEELDARGELSKRLGLKPTGRWAGQEWTLEQMLLLGTMPDADLAARIGKTEGAVRSRRAALTIPTFNDRRRK
ncbi:MAG TPA: hypothetical protein VH092_30800 [Urbifossiella sp.]|jgi:hypothetical protein|nr:hypothetical protein [Urbifossiella sp.]